MSSINSTAWSSASCRVPFRHIVFPLLTSAAVIWVGYKSLSPLPPSPERRGAIAAGIWLLAGAVLMFAMDRDRRRGWATDVRLAIHERQVPALSGEELS